MAKGRKTGGRRPGSTNKVTASVKVSLLNVYELIGGTEAMAKWAKANPGEFYKLWVKTLPQEVKAEVRHPDGLPVQVTEIVVRTREEARALLESINSDG